MASTLTFAPIPATHEWAAHGRTDARWRMYDIDGENITGATVAISERTGFATTVETFWLVRVSGIALGTAPSFGRLDFIGAPTITPYEVDLENYVKESLRRLLT